MTKQLNVLVTGSDAPGFPSIVKSLKLSKKYSCKIIATDWKHNLKGNYFSTNSYKLPDNKSPEFITELLAICKKEKIDLLFPIRTDDQVPICNHMKDFAEIGTIPIVITPNSELMETAVNKQKMLEYISKVSNLSTLNYFVVNKKTELIDAAKKLNYPKTPICIKPAHASGSRGFRILDPNIDRKKLFFEEKPTNRHSTLEEILDILGEEFQDMLLMEFLEEPEFSVDILCYKGKIFAIIPRKRVKMSGGITVKGVIEKLPDETNNFICKLVESFGFSYSVGLQFRKSMIDDTYHLLEINPRLQGTTVFSVASGVNVLESIIDMAYKEFDFNFKPDIKYGLKLERTYLELFEYKNNVYLLENL